MNTPFRKPRPAGTTLPKATVFRALRPKLGGRPLPAAGGQPRHCTGARPNPFLAVGSRNFYRNHLKKPSILDRDAFRCFRRGMPLKARKAGSRTRLPARRVDSVTSCLLYTSDAADE